MRCLVLVAAVLAFAVLLPQATAKFYKDYSSINSRIPGDELILHTSHAIQNFDFFAIVKLDVRYPQDQSVSKYTLSHILVTGQDDTGYLGVKFDAGGPGTDSMRMKIIFNDIKNGDFEMFVYGKKK